ncbi:Iron/ascorbate family oxidoreductases protein [Dioscorea alata]|uniref:Iron/ascorbate family oxidoreductases protein n=1 Tax=Dioscorea alata TaxID=55571 RepID=A0ACB7UIX4_DIOAL|nr:Iron/ascorbate family oxidoreductases protein [Dioscorea alata]
MGSKIRVEIPKIDFTGVELSKTGTKEWDKAKEKVMEALEKHGCFEAMLDRVTMELKDEFFGPVLDELFIVPLDLNILNSYKPLQGYIPKRPELGSNFESLVGWGAEKHFESLVKSMTHIMRMSEYGPPPVNQETMVAMTTHKDMNLLTIICQHHGQGLELQTKSGDRFRASPCSFTVIIGESFEAWSNGRLTPTKYRVKMSNNDTRRSIGLASQFKYGRMIQAPDELVNQDNPLQHKPYTYEGYLNFLFSEEPWGKELKTLKAYCGVEGKEMMP